MPDATTASDWLPTFEFGLANDSSCLKRPVRVSGAEGRFTLKLDARQSSSRWQPPALNVDRPTAAFEASELSLYRRPIECLLPTAPDSRTRPVAAGRARRKRTFAHFGVQSKSRRWLSFKNRAVNRRGRSTARNRACTRFNASDQRPEEATAASDGWASMSSAARRASTFGEQAPAPPPSPPSPLRMPQG